MSGKTFGIIGCGRIGTCVARLAKSFGCKVIGYDPYLHGHDDVALCSLEGLMGQADIVTLHIPYSQSSRHIISEKNISLMKREAVLINTGRGGLVDENSLYAALKANKISGAALDCFENEPYTGNLIELDNVLLTSHAGSNAREARLVMEQQSLNNLIQALHKIGLYKTKTVQ